MIGQGATGGESGGNFSRAQWYERMHDWEARLAREVPVLLEVVGPPAGNGILDAGCGTGRHACALAARGYRVVAADLSDEMLDVGRRVAEVEGVNVRFVCAPFQALPTAVGGGFDAVYCIGNALVAAGDGAAVQEALRRLCECLKPGGRLFIQTLNFPLLRVDDPCVRGPKVRRIDGVEYISLKHYHFASDSVLIVHSTLFNDSQWRCWTHCGTVYPVTLDELSAWCVRLGLHVDEVWGSYGREPFDPSRSGELLLVGTKQDAPASQGGPCLPTCRRLRISDCPL